MPQCGGSFGKLDHSASTRQHLHKKMNFLFFCCISLRFDFKSLHWNCSLINLINIHKINLHRITYLKLKPNPKGEKLRNFKQKEFRNCCDGRGQQKIRENVRVRPLLRLCRGSTGKQICCYSNPAIFLLL